MSIPGVYGGWLDKFPLGAAFAKGLTLKMGQTHMHKYLPLLLERIERGEIDPSFIITHRVTLDEAPDDVPDVPREGGRLHQGRDETLTSLNSFRSPGECHGRFDNTARRLYRRASRYVRRRETADQGAAQARQGRHARPNLRDAFEAHLEETRGQIERLELVFESLGEKARGKHCEGIAGIIEEGKSIMEEDFDETTMDACLIAAGQRAEHYEMAAYGTLVAWAQAMGHNEAASLLQQTLEEEKAADAKLTTIAESGINQDAAEAAHPEDEDDEEESGEEELAAVLAPRPPTAKTAKRSSRS